MHIPVKLMCTHCCFILCCGFMVQGFVPVVHKVFFLHIVLVKHILSHCAVVSVSVGVGVCACFRALAYYRGYKKSPPQPAFSM